MVLQCANILDFFKGRGCKPPNTPPKKMN